MLFDSPAIRKKLGTVKVLRAIKVDDTNYLNVAQALGLNVKRKGVTASTIYIVQKAPEIQKKKKGKP
ncbi:hypothetical protein [Candidatus Nitrospira nitrificans]|uniref:Uncharacterized protein n=1 Tax=Candidatus Nitrospira nitrificans TaxID=1742973 RepID=A0A0S4LKP5_9BACT|nr:hypothetical protein [Candidatus Nitrospira nitrificans]CUS37839.1 hypothetical protein COMA2_40052 [Candidatus Nitrospira nitrificans]